jgi:AbrB family looped-hinge helix DNA binding protein
MDLTARMTSKGQLTVPKAVRDALGLDEGDEVLFRVEQSRAVLAKTPELLDLAGSVPVPAGKRGTAWDEVLRQARQDRAGTRQLNPRPVVRPLAGADADRSPEGSPPEVRRAAEPRYRRPVAGWRPPGWLEATVNGVLADLHGDRPVAGVRVVVYPEWGDGVIVSLVELSERDFSSDPLEFPEDSDTQPPADSSEQAEIRRWTGGSIVWKSLPPPQLAVAVAEILQEALAETAAGWGQARPPCPYHPHPARPKIKDDEPWWVCSTNDQSLWRIGQGDIPGSRRQTSRRKQRKLSRPRRR